MTALASVRGALGASYSREHEREADELGIKLTAMACYDTKEASRVFHKMHLQNVESGLEASSGRVGLLSFFDTHPPSDERFQSLLEVRCNDFERSLLWCFLSDYGTVCL